MLLRVDLKLPRWREPSSLYHSSDTQNSARVSSEIRGVAFNSRQELISSFAASGRRAE